MARKLVFTVDRTALDVEIGGEVFHAPPILAPATLGLLLDKQTSVQSTIGKVSEQAEAGESGAITGMLAVLSHPPGEPPDGGAHDPGIFDLIFGATDSADRFRERLYSPTNSFDLLRELLPAVTALIEEYTDRPTQPSLPSSTFSGSDGTALTGGAPPPVLTPAALVPTTS